MSNEPLSRMRRGAGSGLAFVVAGPSGAGKTTAINRLLQRLDRIAYSVSHTTRAKRTGEVNGRDYAFVSEDQFGQMIEQDAFVEHVTYLGARYGTSKQAIRHLSERGFDALLNIEVEGARRLHTVGLGDMHVVYVFFTPSSLDILGDRLRARGSDTEEEIAGRLAIAAREMKAIGLFDYLVINDDLDTAVDELAAIIVAERLRIVSQMQS
jgi:guanylate kinase